MDEICDFPRWHWTRFATFPGAMDVIDDFPRYHGRKWRLYQVAWTRFATFPGTMDVNDDFTRYHGWELRLSQARCPKMTTFPATMDEICDFISCDGPQSWLSQVFQWKQPFPTSISPSRSPFQLSSATLLLHPAQLNHPTLSSNTKTQHTIQGKLQGTPQDNLLFLRKDFCFVVWFINQHECGNKSSLVRKRWYEFLNYSLPALNATTYKWAIQCDLSPNKNS